MPHFEAIVVGMGAAGSAAAYHLARRSVRVLALDRSTIPNSDASHAGITRIIRQAYFEHPDYVPLLRRAYTLWRELEGESSRQILHTPGMLYAGPADGPLVSGCLESSREHALPLETLSAGEAVRRFPGFHIPESHTALFEPLGGYLLADEAIRAHAEGAKSHGAVVHDNEPVKQWGADAHGAWVETSQGRYSADRLILAAGAWMPTIAKLPTDLRVTLQTLVWMRPRNPALFSGPAAPVWAISDDDGSLFYGFPFGAGSDGLKAAHHHPGTPIDPDRGDRSASSADVERVTRFLSRRLPESCGSIIRTCTCLYTSTTDQHFIIDRHPIHERVIVASPCSGHGFKFATAIGEALADLATTGKSNLPIHFLSLSRFQNHKTNPTP